MIPFCLQIIKYLGQSGQTKENSNPNILKEARCALCNRKQNRQTNTFCNLCEKSYRQEHPTNLCKKCENRF